jgi:undecaprenyl-diphosphatase
MRVSYPAPATIESATPATTGRRDGRADPHPTRRLVGILLAAYAMLAAGCIALGLLITQAAYAAGIRRWDTSVTRSFARGRTGVLDDLTAVGSHLAATPTVVGVGLLVVTLLWWRRRDLYAVGLLVVGLSLEVTVFLTTTLFVDRSRPPVHQLDAAPPTSSFPSGHTAAAIVLSIGLVIVVRRTWGRSAATVGLVVVLMLVPIAVALSRVYRGMHQPTDVLAGAGLGVAALVVASVAVRATILRSGRPDPLGPRHKVPT